MSMPCLNSDESLQQAISEFNGLKAVVRVKLGCFSSVCTNWLPDIDAFLCKSKYPDIEIEVFQGTYDDVTYWLKNGVVDLGFLSTYPVRRIFRLSHYVQGSAALYRSKRNEKTDKKRIIWTVEETQEIISL